MPAATTGTQTTIGALPKEKAAAQIQPIYDKLTHVFGHMPSFFGTMARVPEALEHFLPLYAAVIDKGTVEPKYKELAYLKTSQLNGCEYCFKAHCASGQKNGVTPDQIKALPMFQRSDLFNDQEKATLLWAEKMTRGASCIRDGALSELKKYYNEDQIVELTLTVCMANFTNRFNDAMLCPPDLG